MERGGEGGEGEGEEGAEETLQGLGGAGDLVGAGDAANADACEAYSTRLSEICDKLRASGISPV